MRGYAYFFLVFAMSLVLISSTGFYSLPQSDSSELISIEKTYQSAMNAKEVLREAGFQGAETGVNVYLLSLPFGKKPDPQELRNAAKNGAYLEMLKTSEKLEQEEIFLWCGYPSTNELAQLRARMLFDKNPFCSGCAKFSQPQCAEFVDIELEGFTVKALTFHKEEFFRRGIIGVSVPRFDSAAVTNLESASYE